MPPSPWAPQFSDSRAAHPQARPHFSLGAEVKALLLLEDHGGGSERWFINSADVD